MPISVDADSLICRFEGRIRQYFRNKGRNPEYEEDLVQEAFLSILKALPRFEGRSAAATWVYAICGNVLKKYIRDSRRRVLREENSLEEPVDTHLHRTLSPDDSILLHSFTQDLSEPLKTLYQLYYVEGRSVRYMAVTLSMPKVR